MTRDEIGRMLVALRRSLEPAFARARTAGDIAEAARLEALATEIDAVLDERALTGLADLAARLTDIRRRIDGLAADASAAGDTPAADLAGRRRPRLVNIVRRD